MTECRGQMIFDFIDAAVRDSGREYADDMMAEWQECLAEMASAGINVAAVKMDVDIAAAYLKDRE